MGWNLEAIWDSTENPFFPFHNSFSNYWPLQVLNGISKNSWMPWLLSNGTFQFCMAVLFQASSPEWGIWNYCCILPLTHFLYSWPLFTADGKNIAKDNGLSASGAWIYLYFLNLGGFSNMFIGWLSQQKTATLRPDPQKSHRLRYVEMVWALPFTLLRPCGASRYDLKKTSGNQAQTGKIKKAGLYTRF